MRLINERGIEIVKSFEGLALLPYVCAGGVISVWVMAVLLAASADLLILIWKQFQK